MPSLSHSSSSVRDQGFRKRRRSDGAQGPGPVPEEDHPQVQGADAGEPEPGDPGQDRPGRRGGSDSVDRRQVDRGGEGSGNRAATVQREERHHGQRRRQRQAGTGDGVARLGAGVPLPQEQAGDERSGEGALPDEVQQHPGDRFEDRVHASSSSRSSICRICSRSSAVVFWEESAWSTRLPGAPPKARSIRSPTSCFWVSLRLRAGE